MFEPAESAYAETINRAAMMLLAMSFKPDLRSSLVDEVATAIDVRGGRIDGQWYIKIDLRAVCEEIVERAMAILSAALRERLPGIADEMDEAFGDRLRTLLASIARLFPTL
jgi:hypothetical protein